MKGTVFKSECNKFLFCKYKILSEFSKIVIHFSIQKDKFRIEQIKVHGHTHIMLPIAKYRHENL